jgi:hypothetical protein
MSYLVFAASGENKIHNDIKCYTLSALRPSPFGRTLGQHADNACAISCEAACRVDTSSSGFHMSVVTEVIPRSSRQRSARSNDPFVLTGADQRSAQARRFRDIIEGLISEFGDAEPNRLREIGMLKFAIEREQEAIVADVTRSAETLLRLSNSCERKEHRLHLRMRQAGARGPVSGLHDKLGARYGKAAGP